MKNEGKNKGKQTNTTIITIFHSKQHTTHRGVQKHTSLQKKTQQPNTHKPPKIDPKKTPKTRMRKANFGHPY
jgi:hypothetical protein